MKKRHLFAALVAAALCGCASPPVTRKALLTYETSPPGATLYEGGKALGMAPLTRSYTVPEGATTVRTPDVTAVWPSGAKEVYFTLLPRGADLVATIERPAAAPGLQADLEHGRRLAATLEQAGRRQKEALQRDQARASERCQRQTAGGGLAVADDCS